jgi:hypothetical protein
MPPINDAEMQKKEDLGSPSFFDKLAKLARIND